MLVDDNRTRKQLSSQLCSRLPRIMDEEELVHKTPKLRFYIRSDGEHERSECRWVDRFPEKESSRRVG